MNNTDFQIIQNFRDYAKSGSKIEQKPDAVYLNDEPIQGAKSSQSSSIIKYSRINQAKTLEKKRGSIVSLHINGSSVLVGGDFAEHEVYSIPSDYNVVYKSINKTGIGLSDWIVNLVLRKGITDDYKFLVVTGATTIEKDKTLLYRTGDSYDFKRLSNIIFQHGFVTGYDVSLLKESYTEASSEILSYNLRLGYGLLIYKNGHILSETPILLQAFSDPIVPIDGLDPDFNPIKTLPQVLTIDAQNFTITKTKSYVLGLLKTTITKTVGTTHTIVWEHTEPDIIPTAYEPVYTYEIIRNPPFTDSRDELQCALSGFNNNVLVVTYKRNGLYDNIEYFQYSSAYNETAIPYFESTTITLPSEGSILSQTQTSYFVYVDLPTPYDAGIGSTFATRQLIFTCISFTTEYITAPGVFVITGQDIINISTLNCTRPTRPPEPYSGSRRIESYSSNLIKEEDIVIADPLFNIVTNTDLPDISVVKSPDPPVGDSIKECTITPTYPLSIPLTLPDTTREVRLRNKEKYNGFADFGYPQSLVVKNGIWSYSDIGTYSDAGDTVIEGGDTLYLQELASIVVGLSRVTHDVNNEHRISSGWNLGYITKSKEFETDANTIVCVGDFYSITKEFVLDYTFTLYNYNLVAGLSTITGDFKFAEKYQFITGAGILQNNRIITCDYGQINITNPAQITGTTNLVLKGESIYKLQDREYRRSVLFTPDDLYPHGDPRNSKFILDISLGKPNLIGKVLHLVTKVNDDETADSLSVDLSTATPSFSITNVPYLGTLLFEDISVIE